MSRARADVAGDIPARNAARARAILSALAHVGVAEWVLCPGGRNAPFVVQLDRVDPIGQPGPTTGAHVWQHFEERSAAFFALGRARVTGRPVAIVVTSGTAVGELLPAAIEAHHGGGQLIFVTADRPVRFRGTGAPQTIEQVGIFGPHAACVDLGDDGEQAEHERLTAALASYVAPPARACLHVNVAFDEPLVARRSTPPLVLEPGLAPAAIDDPAAPSTAAATLTSCITPWSRPLVIVAGLREAAREAVRALLLRLQAACILEPDSGLARDPSLAHLELVDAEAWLTPERVAAHFDGVLRLGGIPLSRVWRDLPLRLSAMPVVSWSEQRWPGLPHAPHRTMVTASGSCLAGVERALPSEGRFDPEPVAHSRARSDAACAALADAPASERALVYAVAQRVRPIDRVYLGNSLPIRHWHALAPANATRDVWASRGANGIDGQLSTGWGLVEDARRHYLIVGELTAGYDLAAPWISEQVRARCPDADVRIVVIDNGGAGIFASMFESARFRHAGPHARAFDLVAWAQSWGLACAHASSAQAIQAASDARDSAVAAGERSAWVLILRANPST